MYSCSHLAMLSLLYNGNHKKRDSNNNHNLSNHNHRPKRNLSKASRAWPR